MTVVSGTHEIASEFAKCMGYKIASVSVVEQKGLIFSREAIQIELDDSASTKRCIVTFPC